MANSNSNNNNSNALNTTNSDRYLNNVNNGLDISNDDADDRQAGANAENNSNGDHGIVDSNNNTSSHNRNSNTNRNIGEQPRSIPTPQDVHTREKLFDFIALLQGRRMDDQRAILKPSKTQYDRSYLSNSTMIQTTRTFKDDICHYYHMHDKKLGEGGFAKVRLATHLATRQYVAIKCLDKIKLGSELPRIYNEIECLKKLKHKNIAKLYQVFETQTAIYLVLEYCAGGELFDYIVSKNKLEESESAQIIYDLMRVLDFIHVNGFAHRDLKPENVLFDERHQIKLIDFGLAANCSTTTVTTANKLDTTKQPPAIDQLTTCCGSVTYAAPEVISGGSYSGTAADVWSAGVMMYALLVGQLPFNDNSISKLYQKIQAGIKSLPSFLSKEACDLIKKMLTVDPKHRITVREVLIHPWLRNRTINFSRINRRLEFNGMINSGHQIDDQLLARCCAKFPHLTAQQLRDYIQADFNYYSTTYQLMLDKCPQMPIRTACAVKRTPEKRQPPPVMSPVVVQLNSKPMSPSKFNKNIVNNNHIVHVSPTKRTRFVTVTNTPKTPRTPPSYLRHLQDSSKRTSTSQPATPTTNDQENNGYKMEPFICGPTPKKSIVKRLLESATPSKMKQPRRIVFHQNEFMNITLTSHKDPNLCLAHFQQALIKKGFQCKRRDFSLKCYNQSIRLTLEVCIYNNLCAIQRKRIKGDAWQYKLVCEEILRISNTGGTESIIGGGSISNRATGAGGGTNCLQSAINNEAVESMPSSASDSTNCNSDSSTTQLVGVNKKAPYVTDV